MVRFSPEAGITGPFARRSLRVWRRQHRPNGRLVRDVTRSSRHVKLKVKLITNPFNPPVPLHIFKLPGVSFHTFFGWANPLSQVFRAWQDRLRSFVLQDACRFFSKIPPDQGVPRDSGFPDASPFAASCFNFLYFSDNSLLIRFFDIFLSITRIVRVPLFIRLHAAPLPIMAIKPFPGKPIESKFQSGPFPLDILSGIP